MADIAVTAAKVAAVYPELSEIFSGKLAAAATKGQALYQNSSGTFALADANAGSNAEDVRGLALEAGAIGAVISILKRGFVSGFTLGTIDSLVYVSDTAGALSTTEGTTSVRCGRVTVLPGTSTTVLWFEADWLSNWGTR